MQHLEIIFFPTKLFSQGWCKNREQNRRVFEIKTKAIIQEMPSVLQFLVHEGVDADTFFFIKSLIFL